MVSPAGTFLLYGSPSSFFPPVWYAQQVVFFVLLLETLAGSALRPTSFALLGGALPVARLFFGKERSRTGAFQVAFHPATIARPYWCREQDLQYKLT